MYQYINKTDNTLQHQQASLKNLETQIGQIAAALSGRTQGTLPSNTETNPKEQVKAITIRNGVQLPEIHVTRHESPKQLVPTTDEEQVERSEQKVDEATEQNSDTPQVKATVLVKAYIPPIPFSQRL
ncbi:Uncharacterized protein Adt_18636 [Abeliophyllum distichum]|uniref:Uncharacterized protein n=1 Tax=Abeliophyllum distichum TaxID=126358 RepID=A0ABD1TK02_9LAMI